MAGRKKDGGTTADLTVEILKSIRDGVTQTNARLDQTNERLGSLEGSVDNLREELSRRIVEGELRTATAITELAGSVRDMTVLLRSANELRPRLEQCERDIAELKRRAG